MLPRPFQQPTNIAGAAKEYSRQDTRDGPFTSVIFGALQGRYGFRGPAAIDGVQTTRSLQVELASLLKTFFIAFYASLRAGRQTHLLPWFCPKQTKPWHDVAGFSSTLLACKPIHLGLESPLRLASAGHLADQLQSSPDAATDRSTCIFGPKRHEPGKPAVHGAPSAGMGRTQPASGALIPDHRGMPCSPYRCQMAACSTPCAGC